MNDVRQILVRGVNWLGDAVMTMPALQRLREHFPSARITLLTVRKLADLWRYHPAADQVWAVGDEGLWTVARRLRRGRFDLGVIFPNSFRSAFELWLGGVRERIGYAANGRSPLLSRPVSRPSRFVPMRKRSVTEIKRLIAGAASSPLNQSPKPAATHHTEHYLHLVSAVGASAVPCPPVMAVAGEEQLSVRGRFGLTNDVTWLGVNPGAEYGPAKRWPTERFAAVAREVAAWPGWGVVIFGARADRPTACAIATELARGGDRAGEPRLVNLAGSTSLRELCAALSVCRVLVTNDTGPMHLAAALGVPVVSVFGSTSPELTGPGLPGDERHEIVRSSPPCAPCFLRECPIDRRCLTAVQPSAVLAAVTRLVARTGSARAAG
ncbi:MAG: lipopolysaccharide heptosyltransferase II [Verrucomicrobia bacterium]|nr:lipopolysaccharide heptosyltransferase II [Verrucomicrobiota bacterium]